MESLVGLSTLGGLAVRPEAHDVRNDISTADGRAFGLHAQGYLDMRLRLFVWVIFWVLPETLRPLSFARNSTWTRLTLKMMKSSIGTTPDRTVSPSEVSSSWIFVTTFSVASPDRISFSTELLASVPYDHGQNNMRTDLEVSLEILENSRRFISRPLTSVVFSPASSILTAAYFFLFRSKIRSKTASRSISRSL